VNAVSQRTYWNDIAGTYQSVNAISTHDFHYGPLLPGDRTLQILPSVRGARCLELGCGAAQNSIALARQGAHCTALDVSEKQLAHARRLAGEHHVKLTLRRASLEDSRNWPRGPFDLVHSVFALPFVDHAASVIQDAADRLSPGGVLVLSTAHPVSTGEWLELEDEGPGMFLPSYVMPPDDVRPVGDGDAVIRSRAYPVAKVAQWIHAAGLRDLQLWEPVPLAPEAFDAAPYRSPDWEALYPTLAAIPIAVIYKAVKPAT
jgi:SAM-dependent methyltransferase